MNIRQIFSNYLAMSQAFPYLQAGSQKDLIFEAMKNNREISKDVEVTSVVGNFLTWDETGGFLAVMQKQYEGLSEILETDSNFHANILKKDIKALTGEEPIVNFSDITVRYLNELYNGLANLNVVNRCACMIAFENHAEKMITALWNSITRIYNVEPNSLKYFYIHVGGDNPAEKYHVRMTNNMLEMLIINDKVRDFVNAFDYYYGLSFNWCSEITILN